MIFSYIYDFISFLFEKNLKDEIKNIILFGSVASGEFDEESDIDIFIEIWDRNKKKIIENKVKEQLNKFEEISLRKWYPRGIKNNFSIIVGNINEWNSIKYDMVSNGILLYGKFETKLKGMNHNVIISFSLNKLKQQDKMKFIRELYGYKLKKGNKKYLRKGLIEEYNGLKISINSIIIPIEKIKKLRKFFSKYKLSPEIREVWMR